jgi:sterol desaturase/sphingolipid hydroxylase (fatty acid hydroxylase superfamily)
MRPVTFRYTREPRTQHLLTFSLLATAVLVGRTEWFAQRWELLVSTASPRVLVVGGLMLLHTTLYWGIGMFFHRVDTTDRPAFIAKHRIQRERRRHPPLSKTVRVLARNQFLFLPVLLMVLTDLMLARGWRPEAELPSLGRLSLELALQTVSALIIFYSTHRFLHRKFWMKRVHRIHHEFKTTTALASEYAHPIEFATGNFLTLAGGAFLFAPHLASIYLFALVSVVTVLVHHSGYALPWAPWSMPHDWHHFRVKEMFGTVGLIDRLLGTDAEYQTLHDGDER